MKSLNNGAGIGASPSLSITLINGTKVSVDLSSAKTIQDVLNAIDAVAINKADDSGTLNPLTATLSATGSIVITDSTTGSGTLNVANGAGSVAATNLGIAGTGTSGVLTGSAIVSGNVTLVAGSGKDTLKGSLGNNTFIGGSGDDTMTGLAGAWSNTLVETQDADMVLTDSALTTNSHSKDTLSNIGNAILTNSNSNVAHTFDASGFSGSVTLVSGGSTDTLKGSKGASTFDVNVSNLKVIGGIQQQVSITGGTGTNNVVLLGVSSSDSQGGLEYVNWNAGASTSMPTLTLDDGSSYTLGSDLNYKDPGGTSPSKPTRLPSRATR